MGEDVFYSGTVAAAIEATLLGIPAVAFSYAGRGIEEVEGWQPVVSSLLKQIVAKGIPAHELLNVNLPALAPSELRGVRVTNLGRRRYVDSITRAPDPSGREYYWIGGGYPHWNGGAGLRLPRGQGRVRFGDASSPRPHQLHPSRRNSRMEPPARDEPLVRERAARHLHGPGGRGPGGVRWHRRADPGNLPASGQRGGKRGRRDDRTHPYPRLSHPCSNRDCETPPGWPTTGMGAMRDMCCCWRRSRLALSRR